MENKTIVPPISAIEDLRGDFILPHKRKPEKIKQRSQKYKAKKLVWKQSYKDPLKAETVCRTSQKELQSHLSEEFGYCQQSDVPDVVKGLIISDSRGHGVYNK